MALKGLIPSVCVGASRVAGVVSEACAKVVQWRSAVASAIYVLSMNSIFWFFALYSERITQIEVLSVLLSFLGVDVMVLPIMRIALLVHRQLKHAPRTEKGSAVPRQGNLLISALVLLLRAVALFIYKFCIHLLFCKKAKILFIVFCLLAIKSLLENDLSLYCKAGYSMLVLLLILPPWQYYKVNQRILIATLKVWTFCFACFSTFVVKPFVRCLAIVYVSVRFVVLFKWLPPLITWLNVTFVLPVISFIRRSVEVILYFTLGGWIPPLCSYIGRRLLSLWRACKGRCYRTWKGFVYLLSFKWARPIALFILEWTRYIFLGIFLLDLFRMLRTHCREFTSYIRGRFISPAMRNMHLAVSSTQRRISKKVRWYIRVTKHCIRQLGSILFYGTLLLWVLILKYIIRFMVAPVARQGYKLWSIMVNEISLLCAPQYQHVMDTLAELSDELKNEAEEELSEYLPDEEIIDDFYKTEKRKVPVKDSEALQLPNVNDVDGSSDSNESEEFLPTGALEDDALSSSSTEKEMEGTSGVTVLNEEAEQQTSAPSDFDEATLGLPKTQTVWSSIRSAYAAGRSTLGRFSASSGLRRRRAHSLSDEEKALTELGPAMDEFELLDEEIDDEKSEH